MKAKLALLAVVLAAFTLSASEPTKPAQPIAKEVKSWTDGITVSAVGALKHENLGGKPIYGTGLDIGLPLDKAGVMSLHVENLAYQTDNWKGSAVDETEIIFGTRVFHQNRISGHLLMSGGHEWNRDDWGFGAGAAIGYDITKQLSARIAYRVRAWFNDDKDGIGTLSLNWKL